ncbi:MULTISPECIES: hypothetical protein [Subtercola]|uniref:Uncharacterized protein n=1 Tax=Subtercola vilae TaxID=2056433 RepID=A0A4T2BJP4_9MICO|nr:MULTISPECIES: hypothetical protein [Subtercola]MEA9985039.1 hypothetical protein [Subtercola sp. RTI3]TIH31220.1 hypothetical protein D4765_16600 [Subtercola vilae]
MTSPIFTIPTTTGRTRISPRTRAGVAASIRRSTGHTQTGVTGAAETIGSYITGTRAIAADAAVVGGYVASTSYTNVSDRIRGSYTSIGQAVSRTTSEGTYVTHAAAIL